MHISFAPRCARSFMLSAATLSTLVLVASAGAQQRGDPAAESVHAAQPSRFETPRFTTNVRVVPLNATINPDATRRGDSGEGGLAGVCPPVVSTYTNPQNFVGNVSLNLQAGMVETEIAAVTYVLPPEAFPVIIRTVEMVWGRIASPVSQTTNYTVMFWEGAPNTGSLVETFSSSDQPGDPPPIVIQPSGTTVGINVQLTIDPGDPDQVILTDNGSHSITIGYRIDEHNSPPVSPCSCGFGTLPAVCCPPAQNLNTFMATDIDGHANASRNWLWARTCPGANGICGLAPTGWFNFTSPGMPSGDWVMRVTYEPFGCSLPTGACCLQNGTQCAPGITEADCLAANGIYRGDGTDCSSPCPQPTGACCINGVCSQLTQPECASQGGTFTAVGTACDANTCKGACCVPSTQACVSLTASNCAIAGGTFQGIGTSCSGLVCFPVGACCLESGQCVPGPMTPEQCAAMGGSFAGHQSTCGSPCPQPIGACCLSGTACLTDLTPEECSSVGGTFTGSNTQCFDNVCPFCPADINDDGVVNVADLLSVIAAWGPCNNCPPDISPPPFGDNNVNVADLLLVIGSWGSCS